MEDVDKLALAEQDMAELSTTEKARLTRILRREVKQLATYLVSDPIYIEDMLVRLRSGRLHPQLQQMLWNYAYGKPKEEVKVTGAAVVKIIHEVAEPDPKTIEGEVVKREPPSEE